MKRVVTIASSVVLFAISAAVLAATDARPADDQHGTLIKGDQEAPLVLYVVPWQDPRVPEVPEADLQPVLPKVLDDDFGILRRSRTAGGGDVDGAAGKAR